MDITDGQPHHVAMVLAKLYELVEGLAALTQSHRAGVSEQRQGAWGFWREDRVA